MWIVYTIEDGENPDFKGVFSSPDLAQEFADNLHVRFAYVEEVEFNPELIENVKVFCITVPYNGPAKIYLTAWFPKSEAEGFGGYLFFRAGTKLVWNLQVSDTVNTRGKACEVAEQHRNHIVEAGVFGDTERTQALQF